MAEWRIQLDGETIDLQLHQQAFGDSDPRLTLEDGKYFVRSDEFDALDEAEAVRNQAKQIVRTMNKALHLHNRDTRPVAIGHVFRRESDGRWKGDVFAEANLHLRGVFSVTGSDNTSSSPPEEHRAIRFYRAAQGDQSIADALDFFARGDWVNLYKAFEIVRDSQGGGDNLVAAGWTTKGALSLFTQTAQSRAALGDEARHASAKYIPPANPMSIHEAKAFVGNLLELISKPKKAVLDSGAWPGEN
jgi:hypothetical protein